MFKKCRWVIYLKCFAISDSVILNIVCYTYVYLASLPLTAMQHASLVGL